MTQLMTWLAVTLLAFTPAFAQAADPKPVEKAIEPAIVIQAKSINALFADLKYIAKLVDQADAIDQLEQLIAVAAGPKGLVSTGLDVERPFLAYMTAASSPSDSPIGPSAIMIPISDDQTLMGFMNGFGIVPPKDKNGVYTTMAPNAPTAIHFKFAKKYLYLTAMDKSFLDDDRLIAPEKLASADKNTLVNISLHVDQIPDQIKQLLLGQTELRLADIKDRNYDGESDNQQRIRKQAIDGISYALKSVLSEAKSIELQVSVDKDKDDLNLSFSVDGKPKTFLNNAIKFLGTGRTHLAVSDNAALHVGVNLAVPEILRGLIGVGLDKLVKETIDNEADEAKKQFARKVFAAVAPTLKSGELDLHLTAAPASSKGTFNVLAGVSVKHGAKIDAVVKELVGQLPDEAKSHISLDAEKSGEMNLHKLTLDEKTIDPQTQKLLGPNACVWTGISPVAVVFGVGASGSETAGCLKSMAEGKPSPALLVSASVAALAPLDNSHAGAAQLAETIFSAAPAGSDRVQLTLDGGAKLKLSISFKGLLIKYFHQLHERQGDL
ncbi:MAG: hypothetical protein ACJ8C4_11555 [Gemmataceae bacterium]